VYWIIPNSVNSYLFEDSMNRISEYVNKLKGNYESILKLELLNNGPLMACFSIYDEFLHYKSGIYQPRTSNMSNELYGHCVKLIGWGSEDDTPYWVFANSWGRSWGENGFFRMDIKSLPEEAAAGIPYLDHYLS